MRSILSMLLCLIGYRSACATGLFVEVVKETCGVCDLMLLKEISENQFIGSLIELTVSRRLPSVPFCGPACSHID